MPKQRRAAVTRSPAKKQKPKPAIRSRILSRPSNQLATSQRTVAGSPGTAREARHEPVPASAPVRKPAFYEALALYESGVRSLQKHDFTAAAGHFRDVIQRYPDERELVERARLY
jgi:TolA-binding protein